MLESRSTYGWGSSSTKTNSKETQKKFMVAYRTNDGSYGEIGYQLFDTEDQAVTFGEKFQKENIWATKIIIKHPSAIYSNY